VADARLQNWKVLSEDPKVHKEYSLKFRNGTQIPTVSSKQKQHLKNYKFWQEKELLICAS
jgi:hypothetical protein